MMRRLLTFVFMALMAVSASAQLVAAKDWTGVTELPGFVQFADDAQGSAKMVADGIAITVNQKTGQLWQPQVNIIEGFNLSKNDNYTVVIVAKFPCDGQLQINMGDWSSSFQYNFPVKATGGFQEVVCEFPKFGADATVAHVLFQCGDFKGTTIVKSVKVISGFKRTIHVATAGTLPNLISNYEKNLIEELTLTGYLNGTDIAFIRRMAGAPVNYDIENGGAYEKAEKGQVYGNLAVLDISGATIVSGGEDYYHFWRENEYSVRDDPSTFNNVISSYMFMDCKLSKLSFPNNITKIESSAFRDCKSLTEIVIPQGVTSIDASAFNGCSGLTSLKVESGNQTYDSRNNCNAIIEKSSNTLIVGCKNTTIPNSVTSIGSYAFNGCSGLTSVTIPNSVTSIGSSAFSGCRGLTSVNISDLAAWCIIKFSDYDSNPLYYAHHLYINGNEITNLVIPNSVTSIGNYAFLKCSGLTSVTIPNSVTSIGDWAFNGCSGLTSVTIPNSVTSIGSSAFSGCSGLTSVTIPNSVESIDAGAFSGCTGLTSVTIPNSVTSISDLAFNGCSGLTSVTIGNSVTDIGTSTFYDCSGLTSIVSLNSNPPSLHSYVFNNVDKNNCVVWVPKGSLLAYKGADVWKDFANIFELVEGDLNLDDVVDQNDMDALVRFVMGENPEGFYEGLADLNGDNKINAADVVKMVDLLSASSGLSVDCQLDFENVNGNLVVSSLSCTLNNERSEAIQLTKCELYCNHNLVSSKNFSGASASVQAGGSKECTFNNLAKLNSSTGFTVCWYYTANGKNYAYRCALTD